MKFNVSIQRALDTLQKNLDDHVAELKEATTGWAEKVRDELVSFGAAVDRVGVKASHDRLYTLFYQRPQDNRLQYAKLIGALKLAQETGQATVEMDEDDYDRSFNDNWDWRQQSKVANATYSLRK